MATKDGKCCRNENKKKTVDMSRKTHSCCRVTLQASAHVSVLCFPCTVSVCVCLRGVVKAGSGGLGEGKAD